MGPGQLGPGVKDQMVCHKESGPFPVSQESGRAGTEDGGMRVVK